MIRWLWRNLSSMFLALALAILIWVVAVNEENPTEEKVFVQAIPIDIVGQPTSMIRLGPAATAASVTVRAPRATWSKLTAEEIHVVADLGGLRAGAHDVPLNVTIDEPLARFVAVSPRVVRLTLEESSSRSIKIRVTTSGEVPVGYQARAPKLSSNEALVSGPASLVDRVSELVARVNIAGARGGVDVEAPLEPVDADGKAVEGVTLDPLTTKVSVPVEQLGGYRDEAVKVVVSGQVAPGYRLTNITVAPPVVTVFAADQNVFTRLPGFVETEPLSIDNASDDIAVRVALKLGPGISLVGEQSVLVQVSIAAIESSLTVQRNLEITGLGPGLTALPSPPTVDVILSGPLLTLDTLKPEDVRVLLNLVGLERGTHQVKPTVVVLPENVSVETVLPAAIEVVIAAGTPAPATATPRP
ncbi:MAG: hypothetical protein HY023_11030 [Chloroflexi bacterium]|nr:hypothetical protein [Chloroflexota bacterium]